MPFAIVAEFPLGAYRGRGGDGQIDLLPHVGRLHSALTAAAGSGLRAATKAEGYLEPCPQDRLALQWLEENPPQGMAVPHTVTNLPRALPYRDLGILKKKMAGTKRVGKPETASSVAMSHSLMWIWESSPAPEIVEAFEALCPDVPYLGQADSPVRMWVESTPVSRLTHRRDSDNRMSGKRPGDIDLVAPRKGRTDYLVARHVQQITEKRPSSRSDAAGTDEKEIRQAPLNENLGMERYLAEARPSAGPWSTCLILPFEMKDRQGIESAQRVRFAVALHRAIISKHGFDAPPLLTGRYAAGAPIPPNRISLQVVDSSALLGWDCPTGQAFVVAFPEGAEMADVTAICEAADRVSHVRACGREAVIARDLSPSPGLIEGDAFWAEPSPGLERMWAVLPAAVETRSQGQGWTMADAVALSVALAWNTCPPEESRSAPRGFARYRRLADSAYAKGLEVLSVRPLHETNAGDYVHKVPEGLMPLPYTALIRLGHLEGTGRAFAAIGQSRHLGGGLLVPCDLQSAVVESWGKK